VLASSFVYDTSTIPLFYQMGALPDFATNTTLSVSSCIERHVAGKLIEGEGEPEPDHYLRIRHNRNSFSSRGSGCYSEGIRPASLRYVAISQ
jgi:hypothetical protein